MKKKAVMRRIRKLACITCLSFGLFMASCASTDAPASNAGSGSVAESQETANGGVAQSEESSVEEREKTPIELIAEVEDSAQRYEQAAKMYDGIKKKVPENLDDAVALLKIMAKSGDLPKTDYNAKKDEVKGILDDLMKTYGGSYCFVNFNGNDISWIGIFDEKGNGIVKKDYANQRTDLFHYEYDANGNILYGEHGVINDGSEKITVEMDLDKIEIPNDGTEVIVEQGARYEYDAQGRVTRIYGDFTELKSSYYNLSSEVSHSWRFGLGKKEYADEQGFEISYNEQGKISKIKWNYICAEAPKNADYEKPDKDGYMESFKWNPSNPKECYFAMSYRDDGTLDEYVYEGWEYTEDKLGQYWEYCPADSRDPIKSKVDSVEFIMKAKGYEHRNFAISNKGLDEWNTRSDSAFELKRWELACVDSASYSSGEKAYAEAFLSDDYAEEKPRLHTWGMNNNLLELVMDVSNLTDDFTIYEVYRFTYNDWKEVKKITQNSFLIYHLPEETQESGWIHEEHDSILSPEFQYLMKY